MTPDRAAPPPECFGHPKGLAFLFAAEMWERFSYYGMRALLVLYMVDHLLSPERAQNVLGLAALKAALEALAGPLPTQPFASHIYGLYTAFAYFTPIFGGLLADRILGPRRTVALGAALMVAGHFLMASEPLFLVALVLLMLGNGAFKPNISTEVGALYAPGDARRDRAYSIFYVGINLGAFLAPLIAGTIGETYGWHYGFASAGVGMAIGFAVFRAGWRFLPPERAPSTRAPEPEDPAMLRRAWLAIALLFLPSALFWATFEQQGNAIALFAARDADRSLDLYFWRTEIPVTWFQAFNPALIFLFTPPLVEIWARLARRGREPSTIAKMSAGLFGVAAAYLLLALATALHAGEKTGWLWLLFYFAAITLGELHFSPIGLSLISRIAPLSARSLMMGVWLASTFLGNLLAGWIGALWSSLTQPQFFLLVALVAAVGGAMVAAFRGPLRRALENS